MLHHEPRFLQMLSILAMCSGALALMAQTVPEVSASEDAPLMVRVVQGQTLYAIVCAESATGLLWMEGDQGNSDCLQFSGATTLVFTPISSGYLSIQLELPSTATSSHWTTDYLLCAPNQTLPPSANSWLENFQTAHAALNERPPSDSERWIDDFLKQSLFREANSLVLGQAERLWADAQRTQARALLLAHLDRPSSALDPSFEAHLNQRLGEMETDLGYFSKAAAHLQRSINLRRQLEQPLAEAMAHYALGNVHTVTGDLELAESAFNQALVLFGNDQVMSLYVLLELGWLARRHHKYDQAVAIFNDLIKRAELAGDLYLQMETNDRLGSTLGLAGRFAEGETALKRSGQLIDRFAGDRQALHAVNLLNLAFLYRGWNRGESALQSADQALALYPKDSLLEGKATIYWTKGCVLRDLDRPVEALEQFDLCLQEAETLRAKSGFGTEGIQYFQSSFGNIEDLFHLCWRLHQQYPQAGYQRRAFSFLERIRAKGLVEAVDDAGVQGQGDSANDRMSTTTSELTTPPLVDMGKMALARERTGEIQAQLLEPRQAMVAYFLGEQCSYWFLITQTDFEMGTLPAKTELEGKVSKLLDVLQKPSAYGSLKRNILAQQLSQQLLPQSLNMARFEQIQLLPDGLLYRLPFALLTRSHRYRARAGQVWRTRSLVVLPTAAIGLELKRRRKSPQMRPNGVLVFSNPAFSAVNGHDPIGNPFPSLPYTNEERQLIEKLMRQRPLQSFHGTEASLQRFLAEPLERFQLIHLATHALCIPEQVGLSGLVFALVNEQGAPQAGYLSSAMIQSLNLRADLVVLSACSAADGPLFQGEGLMGLARAFMEAGAGAVLASLWDVDDQATAVLMNHFYHALAQGKDSASALQKAQSRMAKSKRWSEPRYWAGFCLIGDSRKIF